MTLDTGILNKELQLLFGAICDGLCQEERARRLNSLESGNHVPLMSNTERSLTAALSSHLRIVGFPVQTELSVLKALVGDQNRRVDFRIWMPASRKYLYLEFKVMNWATGSRLLDVNLPLDDFKKLSQESSPQLALNGVAVVGFRAPKESGYLRLEDNFRSLADSIQKDYPAYERSGYERFNVRGIEKRSRPYIVVGLWIRKF